MANTSAIRQQAAHTTYHLLATQQEPYKKPIESVYFMSSWKMLENFLQKMSWEWTIRRRRKKKPTRQKEQD